MFTPLPTHNMPILSQLSPISPIPPYRESPDDPLPQFKALIIGINYRSRPDELKGPVNDAKDVKSTLEGQTR